MSASEMKYVEGLINKMKVIQKILPPSPPRLLGFGSRQQTLSSPGSSSGGASLFLKKRLTPTFLVLLAALVAGLLFLLPGGLLQAQNDGMIEYAENGTGAVATYTAVDPELTDIVSWSLGGTDAGVFDISAGVLTFKESPNYEMAADDGTDNIYEVTVQATDETRKVGMKEVMVEVTNVDEMGTVTLSALRPQSAILFTATLTDPDAVRTGTTWQWSKASSRNGSYTDIEDATSTSMYTPVDADINSYLRATASYTDREGSGKSAMEMSVYSVQGRPGANSAPEFAADQAAATRMVPENTPAGMTIGDPVVATDDNSDILTYTLTGTDAASFDIDWATGQIMTKDALDFEDNQNTDMSYTVTVRATDPSGMPQAQTLDNMNSAEVTVTIMVTNVDEAPVVTRDATEPVTFQEVTGNIAIALATYAANDPDPDPDPEVSNPTITLSVTGADAGKFAIGTNGALTFEAKPDFENPGDTNEDNVYEVTVVATDSDGNRGTMDVKVTVANEEEPGVVTLSRTQPRVGVAVRASLTDPDGSISGLTWQWSDSSDGDIDGANTDTYTPVVGDVGETLTATAMYTDGHGPDKMEDVAAANMVAVDTRNTPPAFVDQDMETDGDQSESTERKVEENTKALAGTDDDDAAADEADDAADNVGDVVMAVDPDPNTESPIYTLSGADAGLFRVRDNGQIEVAAGTELDYETKATYMVTVKAEDSFGASDTIMVTIMVTDMDEVPDVTGDATADYAENGTGAVATYTAVDPELTDIVSWSLLDGDDAEVFDISAGVLTFKKSPDFEMPFNDPPGSNTPGDNIYEVTVQATDETRKVGMKEVMVEVTNVDETGTVTLSALRPQSAILFTATLTDPDGVTGTPSWQWSKARSRNGSYTDIEDATSTSMTYTPVDADINSYLRATASYTDGEGSDKSAMEMSVYSMQRLRGTNNAPEFAVDQDPATDGDQNDAPRAVPENTPAGMTIGDPVVATDDNSDILTYTLTGTEAASFDIDWATGQIVTKAELDFEGGETSYTVMVRATDPAGIPQAQILDAMNSAEVTVNIMVTNVDEAPVVTRDATEPVTFQEVTGNIAIALATYTANDPDADAPTPTLSITGADAGKFAIGTNGALTFEAKPDFENPGDTNEDNVYEVTVVATNGNRGTMDVKVTVANEEEPGVVTLSRTQPRVGVAVRASLTDPDGSISGLTWQWSDGSDDIDGANTDTYTPTTADATGNVTLTATAMYTDGHGPDKMEDVAAANMVAVDTRNTPPAFVDQDMETDGDQSESTERKVEENTKALAGTDDDDAAADEADDAADNVGDAVTAKDPDPNADPLIYTLSGADAGLFRVRQDNLTTMEADEGGQIEVAAGTELDYETRQAYMVTVMAEDSFGAYDTIMVTIMVTDVDEAPEIMEGALSPEAPTFPSATTSRSVAENTAPRQAIGAPVRATDRNGDTLVYSLGGNDAASFTINPATGQLMTRAALDHETKNSYTVVVTATDPGDLTDTITVMIDVTDVAEAPVGTTLLGMYDTDGDPGIDKDEIGVAYRDYLFNMTIDKDDIGILYRHYLFGE